MSAKPLLCTAILAASILCASDTEAERPGGERPGYLGAHAIPEDRAGTFCYIELAHTHTYPPDAALLEQFAEHESSGARYEFIGDPVDFDFQGLSFAYFGFHPVDEANMCARPGQHAHLRAPKDPELYEERNGIFYFESYRQARRADRKARRSKRSSRVGRRSARRPDKHVEVRRVAPEPAATVKAPATVKPAKKPDAHRSWMNRRLGR